MLHPVQGGQGLQEDHEYLYPKAYRYFQVDQGILGAQDHLTEKTQQSFICSWILIQIQSAILVSLKSISPGSPLSPFAPGKPGIPGYEMPLSPFKPGIPGAPGRPPALPPGFKYNKMFNMSLDSISAYDWYFHTAERKWGCIAILKHVQMLSPKMYYQSLVYVMRSLPGVPARPLGPTRPLSPSKPGDPGKPAEKLSINLCCIYLISTRNTK